MSTQSIELLQRGNGFEVTPPAAHHGGRRGVRPFLGHAAEMFVVMMIGMPLFGMPLRALQGALLGPSSVAIPELRALGMSVSMTIAMVAWMRYRGHTGRASAEMGAAMMLPVVLFPLLWMGIISGGTLVGLAHGLMLPSMLAAMFYRRGAYGL